MRTPVRVALIVGVLIVAACTVYAVLFVRSTQMRIDLLEEYLQGRREQRTSEYRQQQDQIRQLQQVVCRLDPPSCTDVTP